MTVIDDDLTLVFTALADPTRRALLERLAEQGEAPVHQLAKPFAISQQAISKHLKVLENARLITRRQAAQTRLCAFDGDRLDHAADWIARHLAIWADRHDQLAAHLAALRATTDDADNRTDSDEGNNAR
ncbi:DNA-binding transcriptional ArsR family regulator [Mumia flava]|uniref:DNA-binding transcriptional ArsR family regulator n=1 Tax=Mumia flava TaxID=1348852 RepID=A0A2M9ARD5_9ACTN|nr:metalloregulator ArsR/SmtB family transcription factor [Mumia flava]PJJ48257.1 DNA-binding transcriptional ArsR family regulator [Mumia flava]